MLNNTEIIGIDHGNRNMKNSKFRFFSGNTAASDTSR